MTTTVPLKEIIKKAPLKKCGEGKYPVLSMTMHDGIMLQSERFKKNLASSDTSNYKVVCRNQLVEGFPIDEGVIYVQKAVDEGIMSPAYRVWDIDTDKIEPDFLEFALHSGKAMQYYRAKLRGTTARRRSLPTPTLLAMEILLPSKEIQRQSIMLLKDVQEAIDTLNQMREQIAKLVKSRFVEMFGDPVTNPKGWEIFPLKELTSKIGSGATPKGGNASYKEQGISLIRSMNVYNGYFDYEGLAHIDEKQASLLDNVILESNDVLLNITGASVARCCIVPNDILPARVNQHVCILRCDQAQIIPMFLNAVFISEQYQAKLWNIAEAGATRQALSKEKIEVLPIIKPPLTLQNEFAAFAQQVDKSKLVIQELLKKHELLKEALMQKYFA